MSDDPLPPPFALNPGTVFNINGRYRVVLLGSRLYHNGDVTYLELHGGPADGINGPEEQTAFQIWLGSEIKMASRFTEQEVTLVVTSIDLHERKSKTPEDPDRSVDASVTVRLCDILEVQRSRDMERMQRDILDMQLKRMKEDDK